MKRKAARLWAAKLAERILDLLYPPQAACICCNRALAQERKDGLCAVCADELQRMREAQMRREQTEREDTGTLCGVHCAYEYEGAARRLIRRLKFDPLRAAAIPLAEGMSDLPLGEEEIMVPVPTTKAGYKKRGFNQAELLCRELAKIWGMDVVCALTFAKEKKEQKTLRAEERRRNLEGTMCAGKQVAGRRVLLVDDIYTTGATVREAARALTEAGAVSVRVAAAARAYGQKKD